MRFRLEEQRTRLVITLSLICIDFDTLLVPLSCSIGSFLYVYRPFLSVCASFQSSNHLGLYSIIDRHYIKKKGWSVRLDILMRICIYFKIYGYFYFNIRKKLNLYKFLTRRRAWICKHHFYNCPLPTMTYMFARHNWLNNI